MLPEAAQHRIVIMTIIRIMHSSFSFYVFYFMVYFMVKSRDPWSVDHPEGAILVGAAPGVLQNLLLLTMLLLLELVLEHKRIPGGSKGLRCTR